jgi:tRNA-specific 2-thiouridylase
LFFLYFFDIIAEMKSQGEKINKKDNEKIKVFVGVSGGVDSSVALALLKEQGFNVTGVFLKVWHPEWLPCDWREERRSAMRVCATLGVPFLTLDCQAEYKKEVVDYMNWVSNYGTTVRYGTI